MENAQQADKQSFDNPRESKGTR